MGARRGAPGARSALRGVRQLAVRRRGHERDTRRGRSGWGVVGPSSRCHWPTEGCTATPTPAPTSHSTPQAGEAAALPAFFDRFAGSVRDLVAAAVDAGDAPYFAPIEEVPDQPWVREGVVLVGDAAHGMSPNMAQGVGLAVEDAVVLAETLARDLPWEDFETRRRSRVAIVRAQTHRRDRARGLPPPLRNVVLRVAGPRIYRTNYARLRAQPVRADPRGGHGQRPGDGADDANARPAVRFGATQGLCGGHGQPVGARRGGQRPATSQRVSEGGLELLIAAHERGPASAADASPLRARRVCAAQLAEGSSRLRHAVLVAGASRSTPGCG